MYFGIPGVPERVETATPRRDDPRYGQKDQTTHRYSEDTEYETSKKGLKLLIGDLLADELDKCHKLNEAKDTWSYQSWEPLSGLEICLPSADICSLLLIGKNPTNGICMLARVPRANHVL